MPLAEAEGVRSEVSHSEACVLHFERHDPVEDRCALQQLADWCQRFTPIVALEEAEEPESLLLDITGCERLFRGEEELVRQVVRELRRCGLMPRVAVADSVGAAWAAARWGGGSRNREAGSRNQGPGDRRQGEREQWHLSGTGVSPVSGGSLQHRRDAGATGATGATDCSFVLGHIVIPPGESAAVLGPLPIAALRLPEETHRLLGELGIEQVGQLEALPRESLLERFSPELLERLDQAMCRVTEVIVPYRPPPPAQAVWSFEHATGHRQVLHAALERLLGHVLGQLLGRQQGVQQLNCWLQFENPTRDATAGFSGSTPTACLCVGLFQPSASVKHVMELVGTQLERLFLEGPVTAIQVQATVTGALQYRQQEMFESPRRRDGTRQLAVLIDRLSSRLGRRSVLRPRLVADAQPEYACCYEPLVGDRVAKKSRAKDLLVTASYSHRPLRLSTRPLPITVVSAVPEGPPVLLHWAGREHRIVHVWGPERIETGWWRRRKKWGVWNAECGVAGATAGLPSSAAVPSSLRPIRRDYYRVETEQGDRLWLFRRRYDRQWFLHGWFE